MSSYTWPPQGGGSGSGVEAYANEAALPISANDGQAAITQDTDTLWIYNATSSTWKAIASPVTEAAVAAATSANTPSTLVERDASGNFSAGTITASLSGNVTGDVTGNVSGSAASFTGSLVGDVTGTQSATVVATIGGSTAANVHAAEQVANAATNLNTASAIVKRDSSGNFSAGTITASLTGHASLDVPLTDVGAANGVASLDSGGKVPVAQLPSTTMIYLGAWNASTNSPTLADGTGTNGDVYRASVAGTQNLGSGSQTWAVGDLIIYNGSIWQHCPAADGVSSVNGTTGAVTVNAINQLTGDVTTGPASGSASAAATVAQVGGVSASTIASGLLASQAGNAGKFATTNGTASSWASVVQALALVYQTTSATAAAGNCYQCNTSGGALTMTLPSGAAGAVIRFVDDAGTWATNNLTIAPASLQTIQGIAGNGSLVCNLSGAFVELSWDATNSYWVVQASGFAYGPTYSPGVTGGILPSAGVPGATSGSAIASGYAGEVVKAANWTTYTLTTTEADAGPSISLSAGVWRLHYSVSMDVATGATSSAVSHGVIKMSDGSNNTVGNSIRALYVKTTAAASNEIVSTLTAEEVVYPTSTTTYKLRAFRVDDTGTGSGVVQANTSNYGGCFYAVRIA